MIIPVALNNIKYRSDVNAMNPIEKNVKSLEDYIKLTKASRYHFCLNLKMRQCVCFKLYWESLNICIV